MPLAEGERRALTRTVGRCKSLLKDELEDQLERIYWFTRTGEPRELAGLPLSTVERVVAEGLREWHRHLLGTSLGSPRAARDRIVEETAFTVLHRLAALRMAEERGVLRHPCIGLRSDGFRLFHQHAGSSLGNDQDAYRVFLERVFDEVAEELPALFDRREPRSLLFPRPECLEKLVGELCHPDLRRAWRDDETIGWVYQDFHSARERKEMREGKEVPENAHELAVRNQLFTPRWVVEFLTDNTLGRLWIDMTGADDGSWEACRFLLRTPPGPGPLAKDPRDLRVLDPACGSGHFLLYAFDLLESIYLDAWDRRLGDGGRTPLWQAYADRDALAREIPVLILRHNLFGVDIDPRPIQVAALALWLRAQRSWEKIPFRDRPRIARMNLVCAEPMPGDAAQLDDFAAGLQPAVLGELVRKVWETMQPVGETGLLLRIDQSLRDVVEAARAAWEESGGPGQRTFDDAAPNWPGRRHDLAGLATDEGAGFWAEAEERVVEALGRYAAQAGAHDRVLRRLFAEDAERGLAFIDLSRLRFDVVLMNPPFGHPALATKDALDNAYPACGHEIYAMFFQRTLELLEPHGRVGAITDRDWLAQGTLRGLRETIFGEHAAVVLGADLGYGVLEAKVETAAVVVDRRADLDTVANWVRLVTTGRKENALFDTIQAVSRGLPHRYAHASAARRFRKLPDGVYAYWMSDTLLDHYATLPAIGAATASLKQGTAATPDFRFLRLAWEVQPAQIGLDQKWPRFAKGGEYRPFWDDIHMVLNWNGTGNELKALGRGRPQNAGYFGTRGVTWPRRNRDLNLRVFPEGCAFADKGPCAFVGKDDRLACLLAIANSRPMHLMLAVRLSIVDKAPAAINPAYEVGVIKDLPWPQPNDPTAANLGDLACQAVALVREEQIEDDPTGETCVAFSVPPILRTSRDLPLAQAARRRVTAREERFAALAGITAEIDALVTAAYNFGDRDVATMHEELEPPVARFPELGADPDPALFRDAYLTKKALPGDRLPGGLDAEVDVRVEHRRGRQHAALRDEEALCRLFAIPPRRLAAVRQRLDLLRGEDLRRCAADIASWAVGVAFGRWDVRLLDHPAWTPGWADPFAPLPVCPIGQLVDARGLPATKDRIASEAWLAARVDACQLPVFGAGAEVTAAAYPLTVAWEGILQDDALEDDAPSRHSDDLYRRVSQVLEYVYGTAHEDREGEIAQALGATSLRDWLRRPAAFFTDHLGRYTKSSRSAPLYWPLATESGGLTLWLYYPRLSTEMLAACVNRLRLMEDQLRHEEGRLEAARRAGDTAASDRLDRLAVERRERAALRDALKGLTDRGLRPHLDDGAVLNAGPFASWFQHRKWREEAQAAFAAIERGEYDWSHLALWLRGDAVLEKCRTELDIAIAHGRQDLYVPPERTPRRRRDRANQLTLPGAEGGDGG